MSSAPEITRYENDSKALRNQFRQEMALIKDRKKDIRENDIFHLYGPDGKFKATQDDDEIALQSCLIEIKENAIDLWQGYHRVKHEQLSLACDLLRERGEARKARFLGITEKIETRLLCLFNNNCYEGYVRHQHYLKIVGEPYKR